MNSIIYGTTKMTYKFNMSNYISNTKTVFTIQQPKRVQMVSQAQQAQQTQQARARAEAESQQAEARARARARAEAEARARAEAEAQQAPVLEKYNIPSHTNTSLAEKKEKIVVRKLITVKGGSDTQRKAPAPAPAPAPARKSVSTNLKRIK